jgi:hypothetical protein
MDLTKLSDADLEALSRNDLKSISNAGLDSLFPQSTTQSKITSDVAQGGKLGANESSQDLLARQSAFTSGGNGGVMTPEVAAGFAKYGIPAMSAAMIAPASIGAYLGMAGIGAAGNTLSEAIKGNNVTSPQALGESAYMGALAASPVPGSSSAPKGVSEFIIKPIVSGLKLAAAGTGSQIVGEEAKSLIENKQLLPTDKLWKDVSMPAVALFGLGSLGSYASELSGLMQMRNERANILKDIGVKNPTLGALAPEVFGNLESSRAATSSSLALQRSNMATDAGNAFVREMESRGIVSNEKIADALQKNIPLFDQAQSRLEDANLRFNKAQQTALDTKNAIHLDEPTQNAIYSNAQAEQYNALADQARASLDKTFASGNVLSNTGLADDLKNHLDNLFSLRKQTAAKLTANINNLGSFIDKDELSQSVQSALGSKANTEQGRAILSTINNYTNESAPAVTLYDMNGKPIISSSASKLSMDQFRELRDDFSNAFINKGDVAYNNAAEKMANQAYAGAQDYLKSRIASLPNGKQLSSELSNFNNYWSNQSKILESPLGRQLYRGEISDDTINGIAKDLLSNNFDKIKNLNNFADAIISQDPNALKPTKQLLFGSVAKAIKDNLVFNAQKEGQVDWSKIASSLLNLQKTSDLSKYFPIESLGLGNFDQIKSWSNAIKQYKPDELSGDAISAAFADPRFRKTLNGGQDIKPILAENAFKQKVYQANLNAIMNRTAQAEDAFNKAQKFANDAGLTQQQVFNEFQKVQKDPTLSFWNGKSGLVLSNNPNTATNTISSVIMNSKTEDAKAWMAGLKANNPDTHEAIVSNILNNKLKDFQMRSATPGNPTAININALRQYIDPQGLNYNDFKKMSDVVGADYANRFKSFLKGIPALDNTLKYGSTADSNLNSFANAFATAEAGSRTMQSQQLSGVRAGQAGLVRNIGNALMNGAYKVISSAIVNPKLSPILTQGSDVASSILNSLPLQKAAILINNDDFTNDLAKLKIATQ